MQHSFPTYDAIYKGYGLTKCSDGTYTAVNITPELIDTVDFPNIGLGWPVDQGRTFDYDAICKRIDEVIAERDKRIGWVKEFAQTCEKSDWTERYLLDSCDPTNRNGQRHKSHHAEAEHNDIWFDGDEYRMWWCMGYVKTSRTKYLYRCFLIEKGYINKNN